jgi:hypothetical protein
MVHHRVGKITHPDTALPVGFNPYTCTLFYKIHLSTITLSALPSSRCSVLLPTLVPRVMLSSSSLGVMTVIIAGNSACFGNYFW